MLFLIIFYSLSSFSTSLSVDEILKADDARNLKSLVLNARDKEFSRLLCQYQKQNQTPEFACLEFGMSSCLELKMKDLNLKMLESILKLPSLSEDCRSYLMEKEKIFQYRQKDKVLGFKLDE